MAKRTQKAGASARYGPRYGVSVRRRAASVLKKRSRKKKTRNKEEEKGESERAKKRDKEREREIKEATQCHLW